MTAPLSRGPLGLNRMMDEEQLERLMGGERQAPPTAPLVIPAPVVNVTTPQQPAPGVNVRVETANVTAAIKAGFDALMSRQPHARLSRVTCTITDRGMHGELVSFDMIPHYDD